jgi:4-amino-4-deoxy-L-arabinose transferase-like glycosyltransferase
MRETQVTLPELGLIAGTRVALGVGLGLLLANRLPEDQRKAVGWTLLLLGAATTVPLAFEVLGKPRRSAPEGWPEQAVSGPRSEAAERFGQRSEPART